MGHEEVMRGELDRGELLCLSCGWRESYGHSDGCLVRKGLPIKIVPVPLSPPIGKVFHMPFRYNKGN